MSNLQQVVQQVLQMLVEIHPGNMTPIAEEVWSKAVHALQVALVEPEIDLFRLGYDKGKDDAERRAKAKAEQEPVAWLHWLHGPVRLFMNKDEAMMELERLNREYPVDSNARQMKPLYTAPQPRREVELTANSILNLMPDSIPAEHDGALFEFARAVIEAYKAKQGETE